MQKNTIYSEIGRKIKDDIEKASEAIWAHHFSTELQNEWNLEIVDHNQALELKDKHIKPLLLLLANHLIQNNDDLKAIYLDERLRYAPHQIPIEDRCQFHNILVNSDFNALVKKGILSKQHQEYWLEIHRYLIHPSSHHKTSLLAVGDCLLNEVRVFTTFQAYSQNLNLDFRCIYFSSNYRGLSVDSIFNFLSHNAVDIISFSFFTFDAFPGFRRTLENANKFSETEIENTCKNMLSSVNNLLDEIRSRYPTPIIIHNASGLPLSRAKRLFTFMRPFNRKQELVIEKINSGLSDIAKSYENIILLDERDLAHKYNLHSCMKEVAPQRLYKGMFHTSYFGKILSNSYIRIIKNLSELSRCKVLLVDFDNTLWSGIMSEGQVEHHMDRQQLLKTLKDSGILLVALSKNSPPSIRWDEMILKQDDFVLLKISWDSKVKSIIETAEELNLGIDSFVFIDDNRHERALVRNEIPDVLCMDSDSPETWDALGMMLHFTNTQATDEAKSRTKYYQQQTKRKTAIESSLNHEDMLSKLNLWYKIEKNNSAKLDRIHELVSRTNQFNTTTKRYTKNQISKILEADDSDIYTAEMGDKFGSLGIVSVVIIKILPHHAIIDSFILSCRAIGFNLEKQILHEIEKELLNQNIKNIEAPLVETDRNQPCLDLYSSHGFTQDSNPEHLWKKALSNSTITPPVTWLSKK